MEIYHEQNFLKLVSNTILFPKGQSKFHWHENIELAFCRNKSFGLLIDGVQYEIDDGDIAVIGGQIIHKYDIYEDATEVLVIQLSYEVLLKFGILLSPILPVIRREQLDAVPGLRNGVDGLLDIIKCNKESGYGDDGFLRHMYSGLYCLLSRHFGTDEQPGFGHQKEKNEFYKIVDYANLNFKENINVQSVAAGLFMDRGRLSKLFRKYSGISLNEYINGLRLSLAEKLIGDGMTITSAALESGFQSLRTYNNVKKEFEKNRSHS